jgi:hypothetical protein
MGLLEYERHTEKIATRIRVRVSHYLDEGEDGHLLSVFGNDADIGAITAAIYEQARFRLTFPDGAVQEITMGEDAMYCRGSVRVPGRKQAVRHMIALSEELRGLRSLSRTFVLRPKPSEVWAALVHRFGLPGLPQWAEAIMQVLRNNSRIASVDCIGCAGAVVLATGEELLGWMGVGVARGELPFPETNGPVRWPGIMAAEALRAIERSA